MKSPLMASQMLLELVQEDLGPAQAEHVDLLRNALSSLMELVTQVLDVSRLESNALPLKPEPVDLPGLVDEQLRSIRIIARGVQVHSEGTRPLVANADRELVSRVLFNLVGNALKFSASNGHVWVHYSQEGAFARVEVVDDGSGIDPAHHALIFEKFGQVGNETRRRGTGLGLTFVKMAVEAQGGQVGVISQLGQGSRFWFTLPLDSGVTQAPSIAP
jgi:signal transduction histidine kinase